MVKSKMSPKCRFLAALLGGSADRVPVGNVVSVATVELMEAARAWFPQAHLDPEEMARLAAAGHEVLGYDTVMPVFSVTQEAAALGCEVDCWSGYSLFGGSCHRRHGLARYVSGDAFAHSPGDHRPDRLSDRPALLRRHRGSSRTFRVRRLSMLPL